MRSQLVFCNEGGRVIIIGRGHVILTVVEEFAMIHANVHRFGALVLVGMLTIGLVASTVVPAVSQTSGA
jgi:hypothetical protein